jgi:hypothetical protein
MKREKTMILYVEDDESDDDDDESDDDDVFLMMRDQESLSNLLLFINKNKAKNKRTRRSPTRTQNANS